MKKDDLKFNFIELRAMGYTYEKICDELDITKPTAVKWGKIFSEEIERKKEFLVSKIFAEKIQENEQGILIKIEQLRRVQNSKREKELKEKFTEKTLKELEKIFIKKIKSITLNLSDDNVVSAVFLF